MKQKVLGVEISNSVKILYNSPKVTKLDVANYYKQVSKLMLPYVASRPLAVIRCHHGEKSDCFFKKHPTTERENIQTFFDKEEEYFYITTQKGIVFQAQMGTIEFHPWGSKVSKLEKPDIMIFDLDPGENVSMPKLIEGVYDLKSILDDLKLTSFLKTSGGKGYHVVVPFSSSSNWEKFNSFAKQIALLMEAKWSKKYTTNIRKKERNGKIFIDYLRNDRGSTCVAPYSLRARSGAPVSMPIFWEELEKIAPNQINIFSAINRIKENDPWKNFFKVKQILK